MKSKAKTFAKTGIDFIRSYQSLAVMAVYAVFYLAAFFYLEQRNISYHVINFGLDQYIPFCEIFIVPYLLWFAYVALTVVFLGIKDKEEADKLVKFLIAGMTIFIVISAVFPNGHHLRPTTFERDNIFIDLVKIFTLQIHQPMYFPAFMYIILLRL